MNGTWDLTKLYKDFSDPAFDADMEALKKLSAEFTEYAGGLTVGKNDANQRLDRWLSKNLPLLPASETIFSHSFFFSVAN